MKSQTKYILLSALLLITACTTNYHYQSENHPEHWVGKNIADVTSRWGSADQIFHTRSGTSYYVYTATSGKNFLDSTTTNFALLESSPDFPIRGQYGIKCAAVFKTDKNNMIIATSHTGSNCGNEWAPNS